MTTTVARFKRHAQLYGPEQVFESAEHDLEAEDLAYLAIALARKGWRATAEQRDRLALELIEAGWPDQRILKVPTIGRSSLAGAHSRAADNRNGGEKVLRVDGVDRDGYSARGCDHCGAAMNGQRQGARYCGDACRQAAYRRRREAP